MSDSARRERYPCNVGDARAFLYALGAKQPTFQLFHDRGQRKSSAMVVWRHGPLENVADELGRLNALGAGVFVATNEMDGAGYAKTNVKKIRGLMLDLDDAPLEPVKWCLLKPHIVVETSPNRYQCFWLVKDFPPEACEDYMRGLAHRFNGDPEVADLACRARLPGFWQRKSMPFKVRLASLFDAPAYSAKQIAAEFVPRKRAHRQARLPAKQESLRPDIEARLDELAALDALGYELERKSFAGELGLRPSFLDQEVAERRELLAAATSEDFMIPVAPWADAVNGVALIKELKATVSRHVVLPKHAAITIALWILHAHTHDAARHSPILLITSPTKRCGKTQLLSLIGKLVPLPLRSANVTPAAVFRAIRIWKPTLLIDEADTFINDKSDLRGILNSGQTREHAFVLRCMGDALIPQQLPTWAPKALATIGRIHPTLEDRSIVVTLARKTKTEAIERLPRERDAFRPLLRKCTRWAKDAMPMLRKATPHLPPVNDRAQDNWCPLLAIAEAISEECAKEASAAAERLCGFEDDMTPAIMLLADLRLVFERTKSETLSSAAAIRALSAMEERPWPEYKSGGPISARQIAALLKPFGLEPGNVVLTGKRAKGYHRKRLEPIWHRYLSD